MQAAHPAERSERNYHAVVGKYLSENATFHGIKFLRNAGGRGAHWDKVLPGSPQQKPRPEDQTASSQSNVQSPPRSEKSSERLNA